MQPAYDYYQMEIDKRQAWIDVIERQRIEPIKREIRTLVAGREGMPREVKVAENTENTENDTTNNFAFRIAICFLVLSCLTCIIYCGMRFERNQMSLHMFTGMILYSTIAASFTMILMFHTAG